MRKELKQEQNGSVKFSLTELTELGSLLGKIKIPEVVMFFQRTEEKKKLLNMRRMWVNSALGQVGLSQVGPGQLGLIIYIGLVIFSYFFIRDASMNCVLYMKCSAKVRGNNAWFYLYCWSVKLVSINGSDFTTVRETDKKYIFELFILFFFLSKKRKKSAVPVYDGSLAFVLGPVGLLIQLPEKVCKIWEVSD